MHGQNHIKHKPIIYVADKEHNVSLFFSIFTCKCQIYGLRDKVLKIIVFNLEMFVCPNKADGLKSRFIVTKITTKFMENYVVNIEC